jgi:hypothetical protein
VWTGCIGRYFFILGARRLERGCGFVRAVVGWDGMGWDGMAWDGKGGIYTDGSYTKLPYSYGYGNGSGSGSGSGSGLTRADSCIASSPLSV